MLLISENTNLKKKKKRDCVCIGNSAIAETHHTIKGNNANILIKLLSFKR